MPEINYKQKYLELKQKFMNSVDTAFRLGYEQGQSDAQMQAMQEQQAQQAAMEQAALAGQGQGAPGEGGAPAEGGAPGEAAPEAAGQEGGSELDQHISQLESMLGKSELTGEDLEAIKKSIDSLKMGIELKKSDKAIKGIVKAINKTPVIGKRASANLNPQAQAAVTMQHEIVNGIMKSWEEEETKASRSIVDILANQGLAKKD
jgi:hypothetical protein